MKVVLFITDYYDYQDTGMCKSMPEVSRVQMYWSISGYQLLLSRNMIIMSQVLSMAGDNMHVSGDNVQVSGESTISVNISSENMSSNSTTDINCHITQYRKMILIHEIGTNTKNKQFLENSISKDFKLFTTINKRIN